METEMVSKKMFIYQKSAFFSELPVGRPISRIPEMLPNRLILGSATCEENLSQVMKEIK